MREETELKWAFNLIASNEVSNTLFIKNGDTYNKFEEYAQSSPRSSEFRRWFNKLVKLNIIEFMEYQENSNGMPSKLYTLNRIKLLNYLNESNELYKNCYKSCIMDFKAIKR